MNLNNDHTWDYRLDIVAAAFGKFTCNYRCPYCHIDYFIQTMPPSTPSIPLFEGVKLCNQALPGKFTLHLAGSGEPLLIKYDRLESIITPLQKLDNCLSISLTTNGYFLKDRADELISLGIEDINVSIPSFSSERYKEIMEIELDEAIQRIEKTKKGIEYARSKNLELDLNVCVSYDMEDDLEDFTKISSDYGVQIKFFPLIATHNSLQISDGNYFLKLLNKFVTKQGTMLDESGRYLKYIWEDKSGAKFCFKPGDLETKPQECQDCNYLKRCEESCWESIRISPWYIQPCGIRTDNTYWFANYDVDSLSEKLASGGKKIV